MARVHINHSKMRDLNISLILDTIRKQSPVSRAELSAATGINRASVSGLVKDLLAYGIVVELGTREDSEVGHPSIDLAINPEYGRILGCEIGPGFINLGISDLAGKLYQTREIKIPEGISGSDLMPRLYDSLDEIYGLAKKEALPILGLGITLPGLVEIDEGIVLSCPMLAWENYPLGEQIRARYPIPIYIGNVSHMAALGESYFGIAKQARQVLYIYAGAGISGSYLIDGEILPGATNIAGEFGKMTLTLAETQDQGLKTWEELADIHSFLGRLEESLEDGNTSNSEDGEAGKLTFDTSELVRALESGDGPVRKALDETAYWLGAGISSLIYVFNPEMVVLGGAYAHLAKYMVPEINRVVKDLVSPWQCQACDIQTTRFLKYSGTIGAAATVFWEMLHNPGKLI